GRGGRREQGFHNPVLFVRSICCERLLASTASFSRFILALWRMSTGIRSIGRNISISLRPAYSAFADNQGVDAAFHLCVKPDRLQLTQAKISSFRNLAKFAPLPATYRKRLMFLLDLIIRRRTQREVIRLASEVARRSRLAVSPTFSFRFR